jgi:hypothetical protein
MVMANAIWVRTTLESETMRIPELLPFIGKKVQIIVVEDEPLRTDGAPDGDAEAKAPSPPARPRTLGSLRGVLAVPDDFDDPLPDELQRAFEADE